MKEGYLQEIEYRSALTWDNQDLAWRMTDDP